MLQRLAKGAHRQNGSESQNNSSQSYPRNGGIMLESAPEPPTVGKVDHHSIELFWDHDNDASHTGDKRLKFTLQEEDRKTKEFRTVYNGYADTYKVEGLDPLQKYTYCLKVSTSDGDVSVSAPITVCTTKEPFNSEQFHRGILKGDIEAVSKILQSGDVDIDVCDKLGFTPLMNASQKGYLDIIELLLDHRADPLMANSSGKTSLMVACYNGHQAVAHRLRDAGAKWEDADRGGSTALHWAVDGGDCDIIKWIIEDGAEVDITDKASSWTPLMRCAAVTGNANVAAILISGGASISAEDNKGNTPLMIAALNGHLTLVELLVGSGSDVLKKSKHGKTALDMAHSFDRKPVAKFLESVIENEKEERKSNTNNSTSVTL